MRAIKCRQRRAGHADYLQCPSFSIHHCHGLSLRHGALALKIMAPGFRALLAGYDIVFLQETFLISDQERQLYLPPGYVCVACSRPCSDSLENQRGGVLVLYRATLTPFIQVLQLDLPAGADLLLLKVEDTVLVNAYLPPSGYP